MKPKPTRDLSYYRSLDYSYILQRKEDAFVVFIPELSLCEKHTTVESAFELLERRKDEYFARMIDNGLQNFIVEPKAFANLWQKTFLRPLNRSFFVKLVIVLVLVFCLLGIGAAAAKRYLNPTRLMSRVFQVVDGLNEAPEETKQRVRTKLHDTAVKLKPFASELKVMFDEDKPQAAPNKKEQ